VVSFTPRRFTTEEKSPDTHSIGGWESPRASLDIVKRKSYPCRDSNPGRPARSTTLYLLSYPAFISYRNCVFNITSKILTVLSIEVLFRVLKRIHRSKF
jgi:hypothetical protein